MLHFEKNLRIVLPLLTAIFCLNLSLSHARVITNLSGDWTFSLEKKPPVTVQVPHTWNTEKGTDDSDFTKNKREREGGSANEDAYKPETGTYTKELKELPQKGKRYFLFFEGASQTGEVLVNGKKAGTHEGSFTAFCFEITRLLNIAGKNTITVHVSNHSDMYPIPAAAGFTHFGGLYRPVFLIETDDLCIQPDYFASPGVFINQEKVSHSEATVRVDTLVSSSHPQPGPVKVEVTILDPRGYVAAYSCNTVTPKPNESLRDSQELTLIHPILWQGRDNPYLHKVRVSLTGPEGQKDEMEQPLGLRTALIDPQKGFVLNDYYYNLRGVIRYQNKESKGWAMSSKDEQQDISLITDMGSTALRTTHYPQNKNLYDLCDRTGLVVWLEIPFTLYANNTPESWENLKQQITEMVLQNGNHPSICMWGIFNAMYSGPRNDSETKNTGVILTGIREHLNKLDPRRFTVGATYLAEKNTLNDTADHLAYACNPEGKNKMPDRLKSLLDNLVKHYPDKGIALESCNSGASIDKHENPAKSPQPGSRWHTEEWQSLEQEISYEAIKASPFLWGCYVHIFDSDMRADEDSPEVVDIGLVTHDRKTPKDSYYFYKANWNPVLMARITSSRFTQRAQQEVPVKVYSNAQDVTLTVNGQKLDTRTPDGLNRVLWEKVKLTPGENTIEVTAIKNGETVKDQCKWTYTPAGNPQEDEYDASFQKDSNEIP